MLKPMTIYDINNAFKTIISLFYSPSYGSINITLKKLLKEKYVESRGEVKSGRNRILYSILEAGKKEFSNWMRARVNSRKLEVTALSKLFFLGLIEDEQEKIEIIKDIIKSARKEKENLENVKKEILKSAVVPRGFEKVFFFQLKTLKYGLNSYGSSLKWFEKLLKEMEKGDY